MSDEKQEIKITKEKIKKLHDKMESCSEAQDAIKETFPEAFGKEEDDITLECTVEIVESRTGARHKNYYLSISHGEKFLGCSRTECEEEDDGNFIIPFFAMEKGYEFKITPNGNFRILKRGK